MFVRYWVPERRDKARGSILLAEVTTVRCELDVWCARRQADKCRTQLMCDAWGFFPCSLMPPDVEQQLYPFSVTATGTYYCLASKSMTEAQRWVAAIRSAVQVVQKARLGGTRDVRAGGHPVFTTASRNNNHTLTHVGSLPLTALRVICPHAGCQAAQLAQASSHGDTEPAAAPDCRQREAR